MEIAPFIESNFTSFYLAWYWPSPARLVFPVLLAQSGPVLLAWSGPVLS